MEKAIAQPYETPEANAAASRRVSFVVTGPEYLALQANAARVGLDVQDFARIKTTDGKLPEPLPEPNQRGLLANGKRPMRQKVAP